jgi:hypothetical protein
METSLPPTWVFARGIERLQLLRPTDDELHMVTADGVERFEFDIVGDLVAFQIRLEEHLRHQGWSLIEFLPERRTGPEDRRHVRRPATDRRKVGKKKP